MSTREFNFDGLIGPSHNYAGLSFGNVASTANKNRPSNPKAAALQGLKKMKFVHDLGVGQAILPPLRRPSFDALRELGFDGTDRAILERVAKDQSTLGLLYNVYSASNMWTANAATVSPSVDCVDGKVHFTPANLSSTLHRSIEPVATMRNLQTIFADESHFVVHAPLPSQSPLSDEGAANHTRLCPDHARMGYELFVFGVTTDSDLKPNRFPARQTLLASQSVVRRHGLKSGNVRLWQQQPSAIDAGVFHNDVISVGNEDVLLCHEAAFVNQAELLGEIRTSFQACYDSKLSVVQFSENEISLSDAVSSYLFNSQLVTRPDGKMTLICPLECQENRSALACTERLVAEDNRVDQVEFLDLRQSMNNGGGPACLRLRVALTEAEQAAVHAGVLFRDELYASLVAWVEQHYRDELHPDDLRDPEFAVECEQALDELAGILQMKLA